jgi:hemoglobin
MESRASKVSTATVTPYERVGGDAVVRRLVDRFYDLMDTLPEAAAIRAMHPWDLNESRDKLYWFITGWLGGPPMFVQRRGHPRLRARHLPFVVDLSAKEAWMLCMRRAVADVVTIADAEQLLIEPLDRLADHMRTQPE